VTIASKDPLNELIREVYAQFGLAYYFSECLHRELCNVYALLTFKDSKDATSPRIEEKLAYSFSLTLGQVIRETKNIFPSELHQRLTSALEKRNYLAHRFWFERIHLMYSESGLIEIHQELLGLSNLFSSLDEEISRYLKSKQEAFGITDDLIEQSLDELLAGEAIDPPISQRRFRKRERIVRVWDVEVSEGLIAQIFESEDGCLWQFCDVGLGWTHFEKPEVSWKINETIQIYLPANVKPRPTTSEPWNYEFVLTKGTVLWVKRGKREQSYSWGLKTLTRGTSSKKLEKQQ
jgi:hypothetical protein